MRARAALFAMVLWVASDLHAQPAAPAGPDPTLDAALRAMLGDKTFSQAQIGVLIVEVDTGKVLASSNEHAPLNPASNAKLYTASAALAILHGDHHYETTLSGNVKGGAVSSITLRGHGDPSLSSADLFAMAEDLRAHGVRRVDGDIYVDQKAFDEDNLPFAYDQKPSEWAAFRAPISAVAVNENTFTLTVRPGDPGQGAHFSFDPPGFIDSEGSITTSEGAGADSVGLALTGNGHRLSAKLSGAVGSESKIVRYTRRVDDPSLYPGYVLRNQLEAAGIKVSGDVKAGSGKGQAIVKHSSLPLSTLLYELGKDSNNFYAEMIFKSLGGETQRPAKEDAAMTAMTKYLAQISADDKGVTLKNGSGLYDASRVTASSVITILRASWQNPSIQPEFVAQLAIGGVDGTLHKRFKSEKTRRAVRAKTGTLDDAIALSGYVIGPSGKGPIAFSILFNKVEGKASAARIAADKLVMSIVKRQYGSD